MAADIRFRHRTARLPGGFKPGTLSQLNRLAGRDFVETVRSAYQPDIARLQLLDRPQAVIHALEGKTRASKAKLRDALN